MIGFAAAGEAFGQAAVNHQTNAGVDADQAEGAGPEPFTGLAPHHLHHLAAHRLPEQAQAHGEQQDPGLSLQIPAQGTATHAALQTQLARVRTP